MRSTNLLRRETEQHTVLTFSEPMCAVSAGLPCVGGGAGRGEGGAAVRGDVEDGGQPQVLQTQAQEGRHQVR